MPGFGCLLVHYKMKRLMEFAYSDTKRLTSAVAVGPTVEMRYWRTLREVGVKHPVNYEWCILVGRVLGANDEAS